MVNFVRAAKRLIERWPTTVLVCRRLEMPRHLITTIQVGLASTFKFITNLMEKLPGT